MAIPDISLLDGAVHPRVIKALYEASKTLTNAGIPHALAGALAVCAYGYQRNTRDVDFLVDDVGFGHHGGGIITLHPAVPVNAAGVTVDPMSVPIGNEFLNESIREAAVSDGIPVLSLSALIFMKLRSKRPRDHADVIELLRIWMASKDTIQEIREFVAYHAPGFTKKLESDIKIAKNQ